MRKAKLLLYALLCSYCTQAQETFFTNGIADKRSGNYAFTNATIVQSSGTILQKATLLIKNGSIIAVGTSVTIPKEAVVVDCNNKFIYPSFIDIYTDYGVQTPQRTTGGFNFNAPAQITTNTKGAYGWNQAVKPETDAYKVFSIDDAKAKNWRDIGFGTVLTHVKDGIVRGSAAVVTLGNVKDNFSLLKEKAAAVYSFSKGISTQSYPSSAMGSIALLRQTYLDAAWYKTNKPIKEEGINLSLQAFNDNLALPQIFEAEDKWVGLRADRVAKEFGTQYIIKGGTNDYQRIKEIASTKNTYILGVNFPQAIDVEDPNETRFVSLADMKHWELAPTNLAAFEKAGINFCITASDLRDTKQFYANLRKAFDNGLSQAKAMDALTILPATILGIYNKVGSLEVGKMANFIITTDSIFSEKNIILQNWIAGEKYSIKEESWKSMAGVYNVVLNKADSVINYTLEVKNNNAATAFLATDTLLAKFTTDNKLVKFSFTENKRSKNNIRFSGIANGNTWGGIAEDISGNKYTFSANFISAVKELPKLADTASRKPIMASRSNQKLGTVQYPFTGYGWEQEPKQETILIKNATIWTNEKEGKLENSDILLKAGKISKIGKNISEVGATIVDGTGKHVTAGIIDEHSHIAASSINEGAQSVTSEVRIADNLNPEDVNIYRQLSGGVTTSHILHGSANTIGGQTQLIKLRWGANDDDLKFKGWTGQIKFALGENVKRTTSSSNNRFPDTRMGVWDVMNDAFTRAITYQEALKANPTATRRDLELDALVEILNKKRFITCHSYVQSEIIGAMRIGDKFGFTFNTFTHILEGYKVADKMKTHGSNVSTFSDWWGYKVEVQDAIAYNAALMHKIGLNVCINSDDAEMARRLNQEAAKAVRYGNISEEDALKMVTLNPAKALHVEDKVGSLKVGKDADVVVWTDNPLSIYAKAEKTIVDGIVYFDRAKDAEQRKKIIAERNRLIQKMIGDKRMGNPTMPATPSWQVVLGCGESHHHNGLITLDEDNVTHEAENENK
jgi:imidazolonepropionase-like amidohydrolase